MKPLARVGTLLSLLLFASPLRAQERDAQVLRWGEIRLSGGISFLHAGKRFGAESRESLAADFSIPLTTGGFTPLGSVDASLRSFLRATSAAGDPSFRAGPLKAGNLTLGVGSTSQAIPVGLSIGILPRLEIGARLPIVSRERRTTHVELTGANLGLNPDPSANGALLGSIHPSGVVLGSSAVLPLAGSPAGEELQRRVLALTGQSLQLPAGPLTSRELVAAFPVEPLAPARRGWARGDLEIHARFQPLHSFSGLYYPASPRLHYRLAVGGGIRLPTGDRNEDPLALAIGPDAGVGGISGHAEMDVFYSHRLWLTAAARVDRFGDADGIYWPPVSVSPTVVGGSPILIEREPGQRVEIALLPRLRLTREFSAGVTLVHERIGSDVLRLPDVEVETASQARTSAGFALRYSTIPGREAGHSILPIELAVGYTAAIAGEGGIPTTGTVFVQASVLPRLWGGRQAPAE